MHSYGFGAFFQNSCTADCSGWGDYCAELRGANAGLCWFFKAFGDHFSVFWHGIAVIGDFHGIGGRLG
ncbi:MAG TPA: hypothetical protein DCR20_12150 [Planctomycetaceae bacterium]|nr:hypothetical protein [Planctomycetaceae bacterium]HCP12143.1 hypothetical protein [Planctomycetaceae bacterium]